MEVKNKSAQAAVFLIFALVILAMGLVYFAYKKEAINLNFDFVPSEASPVKFYVDACVKTLTEQGLGLIGLSGGYIIIPQRIENSPRAYLSKFPSGFKMPYWWHDGIEAVPTEDFAREQLESYVESELKNCINNFEPFSGQFEINELSKPDAEIRFTDNNVKTLVKYEVEVIGNGGKFKTLIRNFENTVNIRFKKVFELARLIMDRENNEYFFEQKTIDLLSMDRAIPTTDIEATCSTKIWRLDDIRSKMKLLLQANLPYVKVQGTNFNPNAYVPVPSGRNTYSKSYYNYHYVWDLGSKENYKNMKVSFLYDNYPIEMYARPSENGILKSNSQKGTDMMSFFCLHMWHFTYDLKYPVVASVIDQETSTNKAYRFNFAFKVDVDHNQPNRMRTGNILFDSQQEEVTSEEYCDQLQNEITIFTIDNSTSDAIRDVNLTFVCGRFYCDMGKTNLLSFGASAGLTSRFPYCVNGIIKGNKQGYDESKMFVQTHIDGNSYVLLMNPVKEFKNYKIVAHPLSNPASSEVLSNERASIAIRGKSIGFESFAVYPAEAGFPLKIANKDAVYYVSIYVADDENIAGGYAGEWSIKKEDLENANEVVFHVVENKIANEDDRALFVSGLDSYSKSVPAPEIRLKKR